MTRCASRLLSLLVGPVLLLSACVVDAPTGVPWVPASLSATANGSMIDVHVVGYLPDPCHRLDKNVVGPNSGVIDVRLTMTTTFVGPCTAVIVPVDTVIQVGPLPAGSYLVRIGASSFTVAV